MSINRRDFLALLPGGVAASSAISSAEWLPAETQASPAAHKRSDQKRPPNVVFMICDDLGYGDLGCYGSNLPTPNLDRMAAEGLRCTHFNASHPICSASRAGLLTGRYGHRSNTTGAFGPHAASGTSLDETLISDLFRAKGYKTMAIGKWHLGDAPQYLPLNRGFDSFYGVPYSVDMKPLPLIRDREALEPDTERAELTQKYTKAALSFIEEQGQQPFFLYLGFSYPHEPARASKSFQGKTQFSNVGDAIAEIDWSAGEIIRAIEKKGLGSDTLICFTSDHGPWYQGNPGALRGRKASTFEGGFRVPFLAKWTGTIPRGRVVTDWCSNLDIFPTVSSLCGLKSPPKPLDGSDISAALIGDGLLTEHKPRLYFSPMGEGGLEVHCIRKQEWKLRVAQGCDGEIYLNDRTTQSKNSAWLAQPELYNVDLDPAESYDVAKIHPEIVAELSQDLETLMPTFPPKVVQAYAELKGKVGNISTPPGAAPRPANVPEPPWSLGPKDHQ